MSVDASNRRRQAASRPLQAPDGDASRAGRRRYPPHSGRLFSAGVLVLAGHLLYDNAPAVKSWVGQTICPPLAAATQGVCNALGLTIGRFGTILIADHYTTDIGHTCSGFDIYACWLALCVVAPSPIGRRAVLAVMGVPAAALLNLLRLVSIMAAAEWSGAVAQGLHAVAWRIAWLVGLVVLAEVLMFRSRQTSPRPYPSMGAATALALVLLLAGCANHSIGERPPPEAGATSAPAGSGTVALEPQPFDRLPRGEEIELDGAVSSTVNVIRETTTQREIRGRLTCAPFLDCEFELTRDGPDGQWQFTLPSSDGSPRTFEVKDVTDVEPAGQVTFTATARFVLPSPQGDARGIDVRISYFGPLDEMSELDVLPALAHGSWTFGLERPVEFYLVLPRPRERGFSDTQESLLVFDLDGDRMYEGDSGSAERRKAAHSFDLGGGSYAIEAVDPEGRWIRLAPSSGADPNPGILLRHGADLRDLSFVDEKGERVGWESFGKGATLLYFWASWCGECLDVAGEVERLLPELAAKGIHVVPVCVDRRVEDGRAKAESLSRLGRVLYAPGGLSSPLARRLGLRYLPDGVLLDESGRVLTKRLYMRGFDSLVETGAGERER